MKRSIYLRLLRFAGLLAVTTALAVPQIGAAQYAEEERLVEAARLLQAFTADDDDAIPTDLLQRARGFVIVSNIFRGGFIFGARRGRGVVAVRTERGEWSNPAFVTLTGGSIGWQFGADSTDLVLVLANDNAVKNMSSGKFTLGGDASAVAGPLGRNATAAVTFRAEVYSYVRSRGLFAGAVFEGARLDIDQETNARFYGPSGARALRAQDAKTPASARSFLQTLEGIASAGDSPPVSAVQPAEAEAVTFPLE